MGGTLRTWKKLRTRKPREMKGGSERVITVTFRTRRPMPAESKRRGYRCLVDILNRTEFHRRDSRERQQKARPIEDSKTMGISENRRMRRRGESHMRKWARWKKYGAGAPMAEKRWGQKKGPRRGQKQRRRHEESRLALPIEGGRKGRQSYIWSAEG